MGSGELLGAMVFVILAGAALTALVSIFLLWLYRRAVLRAMSAHAGAAEAPTPPTGMGRAPSGGTLPIAITRADRSTPMTSTPETDAANRGATRSLRRTALVYTAAGPMYALILASAWTVTTGDGFVPGRFLVFVAYYGWPMVLALGLITTTSRREHIAIAGMYIAIILIVALIALIRNPDLRLGQLVLLWFLVNGPGTLLLLAFLTRRVRAVGPLVLAFMVVGTTGAILISSAATSSDALRRASVRIGRVLGLGEGGVFVLLHLVGFIALGVLGWWLLRWLGRRYQRKRMSDQSLTLDAMWLLFAVVQPLVFITAVWGWILTSVLAFVAYKLVVRVGFAVLIKPPADDAERPMLLLLRVFSLGQRSERLFDALSKQWLQVGSMGLISGPDLVTAIVKPHEFLDFVGGRLSRQFVQGEADLEERLSRFDTQPDPDGRHRVNDFFCHVDTWQMTMRRLAARSDVVLMDLRSFSPANHGCIYELEQLLGSVPLGDVVLVVDDTTDGPFLAQTLQTLWQKVPADSPNRGLGAPHVRLFQVSSGTPEEVRALLSCLFGAQPDARPRAAA